MKKIAACVAVMGSVFLAMPVLGARLTWDRRPGVVLYQLKDNASGDERSTLTRALATHHAANVAGIARSAQSRLLTALSTDGRSEEDLAAELMKTGAVTYAEPDYRMPFAMVPNDPGYAAQWYHPIIHSPAAWNITTGAAAVTVAICDTGVDATHPELAGHLALPGYNSVDGSTNTAPVADHGTAVAGIVAAAGNNGQGGAGIAWNVTVLPVRISNFTDGSAWCSDMASGIEWAADQGAKVINLSYETIGCPGTIDAAAVYAQTKGAVVIAAAGNDGADLAGYYTGAHTLILVGATDAQGNRPSFSNYGTPLDIVAPGVSIYAPLPGNAYAYGTGTSFAAPIVSGVAALLFSLHPAWTPAQIRTLLSGTTQAAASHDGYGLVDAFAAVNAGQTVLAGGSWPTPSQPSDANGATSPSNLDSVLVYPNPWRVDRHAGIPIIFDQLTADSEVKLFTLSGFLVRKLMPANGKASWDLKNESGDAVASGLYFYSVTNSAGQKSKGRVVVIR